MLRKEPFAALLVLTFFILKPAELFMPATVRCCSQHSLPWNGMFTTLQLLYTAS